MGDIRVEPVHAVQRDQSETHSRERHFEWLVIADLRRELIADLEL